MNIEKIDINEIENFFYELKHFCEFQKSDQLFTFGDSKISKLSFAETFRSIAFYEFSNQVLSDFLTSKLEGMNLYSPNATSFLPFLICEEYLKKRLYDHDDICKKVENPEKESINKIIEFCFKNSSLISPEVALNIFENNGFISDFLIKPSITGKNSVVHSSGLDILCNNFTGYFESRESIEVNDCVVLLYDGFIQEVSELNKILFLSNSTNQKFVIVCPGASMDVLNTCAVNYEAKKSFVMLCTPHSKTWAEAYLELKEEFPTYGFESGRLLSNFVNDNPKYYNCRVSSGVLHVKGASSSSINKANTEFYLRSEDWESKGIVIDQANYLKSMVQQIATCGVIDIEVFLKYDLDLRKILPEIPQKIPAFAICRSIKESQKFVSQILNTSRILRFKN